MVMSRHRWRRWWVVALMPMALLLAASLSLVGADGVATVAAAARNSCTGPVTGQHIYDCANLLSSAEIATLEADAAAVDRAGAPTVVYLQVRDATAQETLQDAIDLMGRWNVESRPGARDGFVMFFDLNADNHRHGTVAIYAGKKHYQNGNLPQSELDRIRTDVMTPLLAREQTAAGIAAGLQQVAHDLIYGPPPPPASQVVAQFIGRIPLNALALLFAGLVGLFYVRVRRQPPISAAADQVQLDPLAMDSELSPGLAGALIKGRVSDAQIEATVLDFGRRGLLVMEPVGKNKVQMRLLGDGKDLTDYEREVWKSLVAEADENDHTLTNEDLAKARSKWNWPKTLLRRNLVERGWYDPEAASARRRPLYIAGGIGLGLAAVAIVIMIMAREGWAAFGTVIFLAGSVAAFTWGYMIPSTTVEGEIAAARWRGYRDSVSDRAYQPNLDTDLPYIVAMGLLGKMSPRLKAASENGYSPSWFRTGEESQDDHRVATTAGFYPYWIVFHSSMSPVTSGGSASGGYSGGGAAGGGGGSAGSF